MNNNFSFKCIELLTNDLRIAIREGKTYIVKNSNFRREDGCLSATYNDFKDMQVRWKRYAIITQVTDSPIKRIVIKT